MGIVHGYLSFRRGAFFPPSKTQPTEVVEIGQRDSGEPVASAIFVVVYLSLGSSFLPAWIFDVVWLGLVLVIYSFFKEQKCQLLQDSNTRMKFHPTRFKEGIHNTNIVFGYPISGLRAGFSPQKTRQQKGLSIPNPKRRSAYVNLPFKRLTNFHPKTPPRWNPVFLGAVATFPGRCEESIARSPLATWSHWPVSTFTHLRRSKFSDPGVFRFIGLQKRSRFVAKNRKVKLHGISECPPPKKKQKLMLLFPSHGKKTHEETISLSCWLLKRWWNTPAQRPDAVSTKKSDALSQNKEEMREIKATI